MGRKNIKRDFDILEAFQERIGVYLMDEKHADQAYKVLIYSLEYLEESRRLVANNGENRKFFQAKEQTKDIIKQLKKRKLSMIQKCSLLFMEINPCFMFSVGIKFRRLLGKFL